MSRIDNAQFRAVLDPLMELDITAITLEDLGTLAAAVESLLIAIDDEYDRRDDLGELYQEAEQ